jgi:ribosome-binding ATPase
MKIGVIGLSNSGKTTIFNALTGAGLETAPYASTHAEPNLGVVEVYDERIARLSDMYQPKKTIYAQVEYVDFAGLGEEAASAFSASAMAEVKAADALAVVLRNFRDEIVESAAGIPDPLVELARIESELILTDLIAVESRLEKIELSYKRGIKTPALQIEEKGLRRLQDALNAEKPVRTVELTDDEEKALRGFRFLTQKPWMAVLNSGEDEFGNNPDLIDKLSNRCPAIEFSGKFEEELSSLPEEESAVFMQDAGITESARHRLNKFAYHLLGYISFFTVGPDEVRAWTIYRGDNALTAAGRIHSDLARGFIRAETFSSAELLECGSEKIVKERGHFRLEGKEYIVKDGDIVHVRFSV